MHQQQEQKQVSKQRHAASTEESPQPAVDLRDEQQSQITDELLAEIDGVLEENAETFVREYVQKGGQRNCRKPVHGARMHYRRPVNSLEEIGLQEMASPVIAGRAII